MGKPVSQHIKEKEAEALLSLIRARHTGSDAQFAKAAGITGGRSMLHQHLKALKPISPEAAKLYAKALCCSISEFSDRIAALLAVEPDYSQSNLLKNVAFLAREPSAREKLIRAILEMANELSDTGLHILNDKAKDLLVDYRINEANPARYLISQD
jgi:hypothetical protein